ncbi:MAG: tetratricopeptide repeat protein [Heteroscytonema crispum UTEX LB 1556]
MDWTTVLRSLQSDFIKRLTSGCLLHCETEGQYSELIIISGERLKALREFCWLMAEKYKRTSPVRNVFISNLKGKLGEEVVKERLADFITEVDYEKRFGGDGNVDFTLNSNPNIGIEVKSRHGTIDKVRWSISSEEVEKNAVVVCVLIQEEVSEAQPEYHLFLAGFLPTTMIKLRTGKISFGIEQLLYAGGLRCYLEELQSSSTNSHHSHRQTPQTSKYNYSNSKQDLSHQQIPNYLIKSSLHAEQDNFLTHRNEDLNLDSEKMGNECLEKAEYDAAITHYIQALQLKPNDAEISYKCALARYHLGDYRGAIEDLDRAIKFNSIDIKIYFFRGVIRYQRGDKQGSIEDFTQAININPNYAKAYSRRGNARYELGNYQEAIEDFTQAININPNDAVAYRNLADARYQLGDRQGGIEDYAQAIKINPNYAVKNLGNIHYLLEDKQVLTQASESIPNDVVAYKNRGNTRYEKGDYEGAIEDFTQAIKMNPNDADVYYNRGNARYNLGDKHEALEDFRKAADFYWKEGKLAEHNDVRDKIVDLEIEESLDILNF